ncbi:unnamed protein product [Brassicogethes aeneus]|uniref:Uncharacterized protein n=1 Tax=Brassicogethes aeneus TaxID=1431903 RepID=A0A9P0B382_BRAAE|nr:unnamed protein product [Brassicogethes aeneus]
MCEPSPCPHEPPQENRCRAQNVSTAHVKPCPLPKTKKPFFSTKQLSIMTLFFPTAVFYGMASILFCTYLVDWRNVARAIPGLHFGEEAKNTDAGAGDDAGAGTGDDVGAGGDANAEGNANMAESTQGEEVDDCKEKNED